MARGVAIGSWRVAATKGSVRIVVTARVRSAVWVAGNALWRSVVAQRRKIPITASESARTIVIPRTVLSVVVETPMNAPTIARATLGAMRRTRRTATADSAIGVAFRSRPVYWSANRNQRTPTIAGMSNAMSVQKPPGESVGAHWMPSACRMGAMSTTARWRTAPARSVTAIPSTGPVVGSWRCWRSVARKPRLVSTATMLAASAAGPVAVIISCRQFSSAACVAQSTRGGRMSTLGAENCASSVWEGVWRRGASTVTHRR